MIGKLLCRLGLHKWSGSIWEFITNPGWRQRHILRICQREHCRRVEELRYNMLDFDWVKVELFMDE